jgi:hypothetical protein
MRYFKEQGFVNAWGRPWTAYGISALRRMSRDKPESAVNVHHRAIAEARERGLTAEEMAVEFNGTIRRKGGPWTAHNIEQTWSRVNRFKVAESRKHQAERS